MEHTSPPIRIACFYGGYMGRFYLFGIFLLLTAFLAGCGTAPGGAVFQRKDLYRPGTYEGTAEGYLGLIRVAVTVSEEALIRVEVLDHGDTEGIGDAAFETLGMDMVHSNSTDVDTVTGATGSSEGFTAAVNNALLKARADG